MRTAFSSLVVLMASLSVSGCEDKVPEIVTEARPVVPPEPPAPEPADLASEDVLVGTGPEAKSGDKVQVHYTGKLLKNGKVFDSSVGKAPFGFTIGKGEVIKGWDQGVAGMRAGGKRTLTIPSRLAYGDAGQPPSIPPKSTLVFDVELLSVGGVGADAGSAPEAPKK